MSAYNVNSATFIKDGQTPSTTIPLEIDGKVEDREVSISPNGNSLCTNRYDEEIEIWNLRTGKRIGKMPINMAKIRENQIHVSGGELGKVTFSPDGESIMICVEQSSLSNPAYVTKIQIWDINSAAGVSKKQADQEAQKKADDEKMLRELLQ